MAKPEMLIEYGDTIPSRRKASKKDLTLTDIMERLDRLEGLIRYIFDGHVLINGRFRKITP